MNQLCFLETLSVPSSQEQAHHGPPTPHPNTHTTTCWVRLWTRNPRLAVLPDGTRLLWETSLPCDTAWPVKTCASVSILGPRITISMDNAAGWYPQSPALTNTGTALCMYLLSHKGSLKGGTRVARRISVSPRSVELVIGFHRYQESMTSCDMLVEKVDQVWVSRQTNSGGILCTTATMTKKSSTTRETR